VRHHTSYPAPRKLQAERTLFPKRLYKLRARIEQTIGKLKRFKRVALRCEKTDISYSAIISFACGLMLVKSVHTG
jgi:transposase